MLQRKYIFFKIANSKRREYYPFIIKVKRMNDKKIFKIGKHVIELLIPDTNKDLKYLSSNNIQNTGGRFFCALHLADNGKTNTCKPCNLAY